MDVSWVSKCIDVDLLVLIVIFTYLHWSSYSICNYVILLYALNIFLMEYGYHQSRSVFIFWESHV